MVVWRYTEPGPDLFTGFDYNRDSISKAIQSMINAADTYKNKKYDIALTIEGSKTMSLTSDRKYYVSSKINLGGTNLSGNISVSVSGVMVPLLQVMLMLLVEIHHLKVELKYM